MTIKQFKKRWVRSKVEPELFYMPVEKKEKKIANTVYIYAVTKQYINMDIYYEEFKDKYPEYFGFNQNIGTTTEGILYDNQMNILCKLSFRAKIDNIPYGTYYLKIIKTAGYKIPNKLFKLVVDKDDITFNIELFPAYFKTKIVPEFDTEIKFNIQESGLDVYDQQGNLSGVHGDRIISVTGRGTVGIEIYDYNDIYLGKIYRGSTQKHLDIDSSPIHGLVFFEKEPLFYDIYGISNLRDSYLNHQHSFLEWQTTDRKIPSIHNAHDGVFYVNKISNMFTSLHSYDYHERYAHPQGEKYDDWSTTTTTAFYPTFPNGQSSVLYEDWSVYMKTGMNDTTYEFDGEDVKVGEIAVLEDGLTRETLATSYYNSKEIYYLLRNGDALSTAHTSYAIENATEDMFTTVIYTQSYLYSTDYNDFNEYQYYYNIDFKTL